MGTNTKDLTPKSAKEVNPVVAEQPQPNPIFPTEAPQEQSAGGVALSGNVGAQYGTIFGAGSYYQGDAGGAIETGKTRVSIDGTYQGISGDVATINPLKTGGIFPNQGMLQTSTNSNVEVNFERQINDRTSLIGGAAYLTGDAAPTNLIRDGATGATGNVGSNDGLWYYGGVKREINHNLSVSGGIIGHGGSDNVFCDPSIVGSKIGGFVNADYNSLSLDGRTALSGSAGGAYFTNGGWYGKGSFGVAHEFDNGSVAGVQANAYLQNLNDIRRTSADITARWESAKNERGNFYFAQGTVGVEKIHEPEYFDASIAYAALKAGRHFELRNGGSVEAYAWANFIGDLNAKEIPLKNCDCAPLLMPSGGGSVQAGIGAKWNINQRWSAFVNGGMNFNEQTEFMASAGFSWKMEDERKMAVGSVQSQIQGYLRDSDIQAASGKAEFFSTQGNVHGVSTKVVFAKELIEMKQSHKYDNNPKFNALFDAFAARNSDIFIPAGRSKQQVTGLTLGDAQYNSAAYVMGSKKDLARLDNLNQAEVMAVQTALAANGKFKGNITGQVDSDTRSGVNSLIAEKVDVTAETKRVAQQTLDTGAVVYGSARGNAVKSSFVDYSNLRTLDKNEVKDVQTALASQGLYNGKIDGLAFKSKGESNTQIGLRELENRGVDINALVASVTGRGNAAITGGTVVGGYSIDPAVFDINVNRTEVRVNEFMRNMSADRGPILFNVNGGTPAPAPAPKEAPAPKPQSNGGGNNPPPPPQNGGPSDPGNDSASAAKPDAMTKALAQFEAAKTATPANSKVVQDADAAVAPNLAALAAKGKENGVV